MNKTTLEKALSEQHQKGKQANQFLQDLIRMVKNQQAKTGKLITVLGMPYLEYIIQQHGLDRALYI